MHPAARLALRVLLGPDRKLEQVAVGFGFEQALHLGHNRVKPHAVGDHQRALGALRRLDQLQALFFRIGQRLLHQQVFAAAQQVHTDGMKKMVGHGEDGGVNVIEDVAKVGRDGVATHPVGGCLRTRQVQINRGGKAGEALQFLESGSMGLPHAATADQSDAKHSSNKKQKGTRGSHSSFLASLTTSTVLCA